MSFTPYQDGGSPNYDTLYSISWIDLTAEPIILSHPDMGDRYFTFQLASMTSDNFDYVGQRVTGSKAGHFLVAGPDWHGDVPDGVTAAAPSFGPSRGRNARGKSCARPERRPASETSRPRETSPRRNARPRYSFDPDSATVTSPPGCSSALEPWSTT
jgi:hypothetical protein